MEATGLRIDQKKEQGKGEEGAKKGQYERETKVTEQMGRPSFFYPLLPPGDSLRVLTLFPGQFWDPLQGSLESFSFAAKPKYLALSYMWRGSASEGASIPVMDMPRTTKSRPTPTTDSTPHTPSPTALPGVDISGPDGNITLNDQQMKIFHNVTLALRFLRSKTHRLPIWVDAICINQQDIRERNAQVSLMAFIFTRAAGVVSWLGVDPKEVFRISEEDGFLVSRDCRSWLEMSWQKGQSRNIAAHFAEPSPKPRKRKRSGGPFEVAYSSPMRSTARIDLESQKSSGGAALRYLLENPYWRRLWVVQEVCISRYTVFVRDGQVWSEGTVRQMLSKAHQTPTPMRTLLEARGERFSEAMRLEALIERFIDYGCADVKDRVYGLVGLANDIDTFTPAESSPNAVPPPSPAWEGKIDLKDRRSRVPLRVDYSRSFYGIWKDLVRYMYSPAEVLADMGYRKRDLENERRERRSRARRLVRFAGVVQRALGNKVQEELSDPHDAPSDFGQNFDHCLVTAEGYVVGQVLHLGPSYNAFVSSFHSQQMWVTSWDDYYQDDLSKLRRMEDAYMHKIIGYDDEELSQICALRDLDALAWSTGQAEPPNGKKPMSPSLPAIKTHDHGPVRFLGTGFSMGLAPSEARVGDVIIRFWNCDAAILVRPSGAERNKNDDGEKKKEEREGNGTDEPKINFDAPGLDEGIGYKLVGRADILQGGESEQLGNDDASNTLYPEDSPRSTAGTAYVQMDLTTLQQISTGIAI